MAGVPFSFDCLIFNEDHVLQLRSEIVAVRKQMNMVSDDDVQMIPRDECDLNFLILSYG